MCDDDENSVIPAIIEVEANKQIIAYLKTLRETGLYGNTFEEVALRIIEREMQRLINGGALTPIDPEDVE